MPRMTGLEVAREISTDRLLRGLPIGVLTGSQAEFDFAVACDLGCIAFIRKPLDLGDVAAALAKIQSGWT